MLTQPGISTHQDRDVTGAQGIGRTIAINDLAPNKDRLETFSNEISAKGPSVVCRLRGRERRGTRQGHGRHGRGGVVTVHVPPDDLGWSFQVCNPGSNIHHGDAGV